MVVEVRIEQVDVDVMLGVVVVDGRRVEFATNFEVSSRSIALSQVHLYGAGPNTLGPQALNEAVRAVMVAFDVDEMVIDGGLRVTGAASGAVGTGPRRPKRLHFKRDPT